MMSKIIFAACIAAIALACTLHAAEGKKEYLNKLQKALPELRHLAKTVKNKPKHAFVKQVLRHAENIVNDSAELTPEALKMAIDAVSMAKDEFKAEHGHWTSSSSSSSSASCDACEELSELGSEVSECCDEITTLLMQLQRLLADEFPCDAVLPIDYVPFTIRESGKYCVVHDLVYNDTGAAISVLADNVTINFHNHSLTLGNSSAQGILVTDVNEFTLENDIIQATSPFSSLDSAAIVLQGVNKAHLNNVYTYNTTKGIRIDGSNDVRVTNSLVSTHQGSYTSYPQSLGAGIWVGASSGVTIDNVLFEGSPEFSPLDNNAAVGLYVLNDSHGVTLKNSSLSDWLISIWGASVTGFTVEHCMAEASPLTYYNLLELGDYRTEGQGANEVLVRNSTFQQKSLVPGFDGLLLLQGSGLVMENVIVDMVSTYDEGGDYYPGAIHFGCGGYSGCLNPPLQFSNVNARNCIVRGRNDFGLFIEYGEQITFSHSEFTDASLTNVYFSGGGFEEGYGTVGCQVLDSLIANGQDSESYGVYVESSTYDNAVVNCQITNHSASGAYVEGGAFATELKGNRIFGNYDGIDNFDGTSDIYFNTSCNNSNSNCVGVGIAQDPTASPVLAGSNICWK